MNSSWSMTLLVWFISSYVFIISCVRADPAEGSRLLDEAFRDYDKRFRPNFGGLPVPVNVSIHILSISNVNTEAMTYTVTFFIRQIWVDSRLSFNSRRNIDTITMDRSTSERIWKPDTYFVNEFSSVNHDVLVKNEFCRISQEGLILFSKKVTITAFTRMTSNLFPYDSHLLKLEFESYGSQTNELKYYWTNEAALTSSTKGAPGFILSGLIAKDSSTTTSTGSYSRLSLELYVKRNALPYELGYMLSVFLLSLVCLCTTSPRLNSTNGIIMSFTCVVLIALLYGAVVFKTLEGVSSMSILQLHILLCGLFGFLCALINLKRTSLDFEDKCEKISITAPPTEILNKNDDIHLSDVSTSSLENKECPLDDDVRKRGNVTQSIRFTTLLQSTSFLGIAFIFANILLILFCRLFQ